MISHCNTLGGASSISLDGSGPAPASPSIRVLSQVGGGSSIRLDGSGPVPSPRGIKVLDSPGGGRTNIALDGSGEVPKHGSIKVLAQPGGGNTSLSLDGSGEVPVTRSIKLVAKPQSVANPLDGSGEYPHSPSTRVVAPPGGHSSVTNEVPWSPSVRTVAPPGGHSSQETPVRAGRKLYSNPPGGAGSHIFGGPEPATPPPRRRAMSGDTDTGYASDVSSVEGSVQSAVESTSPVLKKDAPEGALGYQAALPRNLRSTVVLADDGAAEATQALADADLLGTPNYKKKFERRRVLHPPGGGTSGSLW